MHDIFVLKVLADVGYANDRMVCIHKKRVCDVALACRRVGSTRVKVLSSFNIFFIIIHLRIDKRFWYKEVHSCCTHFFKQQLLLAFVRMMKVSILIRVICIMKVCANTNKFKVFMTVTGLEKKYYQVMKHQYAIQAGVFLKVFSVAI